MLEVDRAVIAYGAANAATLERSGLGYYVPLRAGGTPTQEGA